MPRSESGHWTPSRIPAAERRQPRARCDSRARLHPDEPRPMSPSPRAPRPPAPSPSPLEALASQAFSPVPPVFVIQELWIERQEPLHFWDIAPEGSFVDFLQIFFFDVVPGPQGDPISSLRLPANTIARWSDSEHRSQPDHLTPKPRTPLHGKPKGFRASSALRRLFSLLSPTNSRL